MDAIQFPVKFDTNGMTRLEDGSNDFYKQLLALSTITEPHSQPITPDFGIWDPTFNTVERGHFVLQAARYVPEVEIEQVNVDINDEGENSVSFSFRIRS